MASCFAPIMPLDSGVARACKLTMRERGEQFIEFDILRQISKRTSGLA